MTEARGPSDTPGIAELKEKLKHSRYERRNGLRPKKEPRIIVAPGKSEYGPSGDELASKEGLRWLHQLGQALILCGIAWDSRVTGKNCRLGYTRLELRSVRRETTLGLTGPGAMWSSHEIPNGAINNQDAKWVLKQIVSPTEAQLVMARRSEV